MNKPLPKLSHWQAVNFGTQTGVVGRCLEWLGVTGDSDYGIVKFGKVTYYAHRVAYYLGYGVDPGEKLVP